MSKPDSWLKEVQEDSTRIKFVLVNGVSVTVYKYKEFLDVQVTNRSKQAASNQAPR